MPDAPWSIWHRCGAYLRPLPHRPQELDTEAQEMLGKLRQLHPEINLAYALVQQFAETTASLSLRENVAPLHETDFSRFIL